MTGTDMWTRRFLAVMIVFGFFAALAALFYVRDLAQSVREMIAILIGVLGAKFGTVYDFTFGDADRERDLDRVLTRGDSGSPVSGLERDDHG